MDAKPTRGFLSEARLRALLEEDRNSQIPAARSGKINRSHYARRLGCVQAALGRFGHVFAEYETELGIATGPMRHIQEMRDWLHSAYSSKSLAFSKGKLDRTAFQTRFSLRGGAYMVRYPAIRTLFEDFDARATRENYRESTHEVQWDRFQTALAGEPPLNKDRLTINRVELAKMLEIPQTLFRDAAFADALIVKEAEILNAANASKIDPYFHGRVYSFSALSPPWSTPFLERIGTEFKKGYSGGNAESTKRVYLEICNALTFIGTSEDVHCRRVLQEVCEQNRMTGGDDWEEALHEYRDHLQSRISLGDAEAVSVDVRIGGLRSALSMFSSSRLVPATSVPLPGVRLAHHRRGHLRSVAETKSPTDRNDRNDYVEFARARFQEVCKAHGTLVDMGESTGFLDTLATEIDRTTNLPTDAASAIRLLLERRLDALRSAALGLLTSAMSAYERGQQLLSRARIDGKKFEKDYFEKPPLDKERVQVMREFFPDLRFASDDETAQGLANLLGLIEQCHFGIPPVGGSNEIGPHGQFFAKRYLEHGGLRTITPMLIPAPEVVGASLTLYLLESGANVSVGRSLDEDCMEASDLDGHFRITGSKARAQGKPIIVDLPEHSPAVHAIQWLRSASGRLRACAGDDSDRLFLMRVGARVQLMTPHWYTNWFKAFSSSTPGLQNLGLTPNMLRPSVLLHAALSNDGRLAVGMAIAQHGLAVSQGYQNKFPTKILHDENMRRFHAAFETLVMSGIEDAANRLGITPEQFEARLGDLRPTGLGTFCKDPRGRPGHGAGRCSTMDCWNDCPNLMIVAEVEAIAALQIWQTSLRAVQPEWERDRPERWDEVWLPWLCLTDVVAEKMARGPLIKVWKAASDLAAKMTSEPNFVPPQPW